jgi:hypothetical protein
MYNNYLLWSKQQRKIFKFLQFHKYQHNKQSPLTSNNISNEKNGTYDIGNPGPDLGNAQKYGWLMGSQPSLSWHMVVCKKLLLFF